MLPDPVRPDSDVAVRVLAAFDDVAARAALYMGERPVRSLSLWLTPDSPYWSDAVDLLPEVPDDTDHLLVIRPEFTVKLEHAEPGRRPWWDKIAGGKRVPFWPYPRIIVQRGTEPAPLNVWPEDTTTLLELAAEAEKLIAATVDEVTAELETASVRWMDDLADRVALWEEIVAEWKSDDAVFNDDFEPGPAYKEIQVLEKALRRLGLHIGNEDQIRSATTEGPTSRPFVVLSGVGHELAAADDALYTALAAAIPKVFKGQQDQRKQADRAAAEAEAVAWATEHGSNRLKMAVKAGIFDLVQGAYRDERLQAERPGWMWVAREDNDHLDNKAMNPSEDALRLLLQAREDTDPKAHLAFHTDDRVQILVATFLGRRIWRPTDPNWMFEQVEDRNTLVVSVHDALRSPKPPTHYPSEEPF